jgi:hypothetical protein
MRLVLATTALAIAFVAPAAATTSGLRGIVTRGPITPVCAAEQPCDAPAKHVTLTFVKSGKTFSVTTGDDGRYRLVLAPGTYHVRISPARMGYSPTSATVPAGRIAVRNFAIDTGIR